MMQFVVRIGMDPSRVPGYVHGLGLDARPRVNGDMARLRRLLAADVPVLVNQWLSRSQRIEHYRLVVGYDTVARGFYVHDAHKPAQPFAHSQGSYASGSYQHLCCSRTRNDLTRCRTSSKRLLSWYLPPMAS